MREKNADRDAEELIKFIQNSIGEILAEKNATEETLIKVQSVNAQLRDEITDLKWKIADENALLKESEELRIKSAKNKDRYLVAAILFFNVALAAVVFCHI